MKSVPYFIILILACLIALQWIEGTKQDKAHETVERQSKARQDSLVSLYHKADLAALQALQALNLAKAEAQAQRLKTDTYRKNYESLKNKPVKLLGDSAVSAELSLLWPR